MRSILFTMALCGLCGVSRAQADSALVYFQKGLEEKTKGRRMESLRQFEKAYSYSSANIDLVRELAVANMDLRRYAQAKEKFLQLEKMGDQGEETFRNLMLLSFNMRQFDDAIRYAGLLKKKSPDEKVAFYLGKSYYEKEDLGNAIRYFEAAAKEDPRNAEIPYTIARAYADMQNFRLAIPYFQQAVQLNPTQSRWIYEMALIYYAQNDDGNALKYMLEAGEKGYRKDNEYLNNLATAYLNTGKFQEGIALLQEILQRRPSDKTILYSLGDASYNFKRYDEAINYFDEILKVDNKNAEALYMIGMCYQKKGDKARGMQLCDKAIEMNPSLQNLKSKKEMPTIY